MKYITLLGLRMLHDYYADQRCCDFKIEPSPETQKLISNYRLLLRSVPNGVEILVPSLDNNVPFIQIPVNTSFAFALQVQNPDFSLFTDLAEFQELSSPLYTNNGSDPNLILGSRQQKATETFTVRQPAKNETFILSGKPQPGLQAKDFVIAGLTPGKLGSYDEANKTIVLNTKSAGIGNLFTASYPIISRLPSGVFAEIEITVDQSLLKNLGTENQFQIGFKPRQTRWRYYVVIDRVGSNPLLPTIEDQDKNILFRTEDRRNLVDSPDPSDQIAVQVAKRYPNLQYFRFTSNALVACRETTRKAIQLRLNGDKVMGALPSPMIQNLARNVTDAGDEPVLYQVVTYFTE